MFRSTKQRQCGIKSDHKHHNILVIITGRTEHRRHDLAYSTNESSAMEIGEDWFVK